MGNATLLKSGLLKGNARLYRVDPPVKYTTFEFDPFRREVESVTDHIIVSAVGVVGSYDGPETYIFPANAEGVVTNWGELDGSFKGSQDHEQALTRAGYTVSAEA